MSASSSATGPATQPRNACIDRLSEQSGLDFEVGGTVYKSKHKPPACFVIDGSTQRTKVLIIDATGAMRAFNVNSAGNIDCGSGIEMPYRAMIERGNDMREMDQAQTHGECNSCHAEFGNGAPGRVMEP